MINVKELFTDLKSIIKEAGKFLLNQTIVIEKHKTINDLLTENDVETEKFIIENLLKKYPDINIISEEMNSEAPLKNVTVVIDPIDGTCNYACGLDLFGIQAAIFVDKKTVASCIYLPKKNEFYWCYENEGCYKNDERIFIDKNAPAKDGILLISDFYKNKLIDFDKQYEIVKNMHDLFMKTRHFGAACIDFVTLINSNAVAYFCNYSNIWDIAPGLMLVKEAGGVYASILNENYNFGESALAVANNIENLNIILDTANKENALIETLHLSERAIAVLHSDQIFTIEDIKEAYREDWLDDIDGMDKDLYDEIMEALNK